MKTRLFINFLFASLLVGCSEDPSRYLTSLASYAQLEREVGCDSKFSDDKKKDIFEEHYKNRWMTWSGTVVHPNKGEVSLNIDKTGIQDLTVDFSDGELGYNLVEDDEITVKFVMKTLGGCFLPYTGEHAIIEYYPLLK